MIFIFYRPEDFDLAGMDQSWDSSQWVDVSATDGGDNIPQFDGTGDDKYGKPFSLLIISIVFDELCLYFHSNHAYETFIKWMVTMHGSVICLPLSHSMHEFVL